MIKAVEKLVYRLKPETGHANVIVLRIHQGYTDSSAPLFSNRTDFGFNKLSGCRLGFPYHVAGCSAIADELTVVSSTYQSASVCRRFYAMRL